VNRPEFIVPPGYGEQQRDNYYYSQAVKIGDRVETAGQGGWTDTFEYPDKLREEYIQAFDNVGRVLKAAGVTWDDVISVHSYHVGLDDEALAIMTEQFRLRMPSHQPIWTCIGVAALGSPRMHVEIRVTAVISGG
jgi:enamine deaminase RidA (YjgF/YER057c/UK114 family)